MTDFESLLVGETDRIRALVRREAGMLLRLETADDLVQDILCRALERRHRFEWQGEPEFRAWLLAVARQHLASRKRFYRAARRDAGHLLRISAPFASGERAVDPESPDPGPSTVADRRLLLERASRAVALLSERDRRLVRWVRQGVSIEEIARREELSYDAAKHAKNRAIERFRRVLALLGERPA